MVLFFFFLVETDTFEVERELFGFLGVLLLEGFEESAHLGGEFRSETTIPVAFFLFLAVLDGFLRRGFLNVEDRIFVEDEVADSVDGELSAVRLDEFGFIFSKGFNTCDFSLDGFLLDTKGA